MHDAFYLDKLYPLQDDVLRLPALQNSLFYLTGGTALGRHYLNHRFSDDLDFFVNGQPGFQEIAHKVIDALIKEFAVDLRSVSEGHALLFVGRDETQLKIDFVNDVPYRVESPVSTSLFVRTDHWKNILSNKISALPREEAKDVADIIMISKKFSFGWPEIIQHASMKDMWVNEMEISRRIGEFPEKALTTVKWTNQPDIPDLIRSLKIISKEILSGVDNSLASITPQ